MIRSFRDDGTKDVFDGRRSASSRRVCPESVLRRARWKLDSLNQAIDLRDLRTPPSNHLEELGGDREGQHSIRINDKYRLCFRWADQGADDVEIVDYH
jgi:toxin HigB-1